MFIKKTSFILAITMAVLSLAGCGSKADVVTTTTQTQQVTVQNTVTGTNNESTDDSVTTQMSGENVSTTQSSSTTATTKKGQKTTLPEKTTSSAATTTQKPTITSRYEPVFSFKLIPLPASEYYGYSLLGKMDNGVALVSAYQDIVSGVEAMKPEIKLSVPLTAKEALTVFYYYHDDYPQHFWCNSAFQYTLEDNKVISILPQYTMTRSEKEYAQREFENVVAACLTVASSVKSDYEREKRIHDYLANRITYQNGKNAHNAYGALVEKKAVCDGYARAFQWLLYQAGIPAMIAEGTSINPASGGQEPHAWNVVKIGGEYYHVDLTWDDASSKEVMYAYFNMTTKQIEESHRISTENAYALPLCTATAANYHVINGTVLTTYSTDSVASLMQRNPNGLHVYIADKPETFITWFKTNVGAIAKKIGVTGAYSYSTIVLGKEVALHIVPK